MKHKCDQCDRPATHHIVEIVNGEKIEKHLCELHATEQGVEGQQVTHKPINELLTNFVKLHSGQDPHQEDACVSCGMTFAEFRETSVLGCPQCYSTFENQLAPLLERAHEGATHHVGKVPRRAGAGQMRQQRLLRLHKQLDDAVESENYEMAARLRDEIRKFQETES